MESLTTMMSIIDHNSKSISDGDYLKLCNLMMDLRKTIPKNTGPTRDELNARKHRILNELCRLVHEIREIRCVLTSTKFRQRITEGVKRDAIIDIAERHNLILRTPTFEGLEAVVSGCWWRIGKAAVPEARAIYKRYLAVDNQRKKTRLEEGREMLETALLNQVHLRENMREIEAELREHR